jgi:hypothetical protein
MQRPYAHSLRQTRVVSKPGPADVAWFAADHYREGSNTSSRRPAPPETTSRSRNRKAEPIRELKRCLSTVVFKALMIDVENAANVTASVAA